MIAIVYYQVELLDYFTEIQRWQIKKTIQIFLILPHFNFQREENNEMPLSFVEQLKLNYD